MRAFEDVGALTACLTDAVQDERRAQGSEAAARCAGGGWRRDSSSIGLPRRYRYRERVIGKVRFGHRMQLWVEYGRASDCEVVSRMYG